MSRLGRPETGAVRRRDGRRRCDPSIPAYLVRPVAIYGSDAEVKIVDFWKRYVCTVLFEIGTKYTV